MKRGFTLIELLIVIAILAVLATAVVLVLNPAELIKQARDSTRISDLAALNSAIALYLSDQTSPVWNLAANCTYGLQIPSSTASGTCLTNASTTIDGNGWVNVNLGAISTGSPLSRLPIDPNNGSTNCAWIVTSPSGLCFYAYKSLSTAGKYKIFANMESSKYSQNGSADIESKDGGNVPDWYEVGSDLVSF